MTTQAMPHKSSSSANPAAGRRNISAAGGSEPSHEQIAARARAIWESKGCPAGLDEENWREAEAQLRNEAKGRR